jgi:hypothetical protein
VTLIYADDRATYTQDHDERYAFGDPVSPLLVLNAVDGDGCVWVADTPEGWAFPEIETPVDRRQDGHGGYAGEPTYNPRALSFEGSVSAPTRQALRGAYRRLLGAILGSVPGYVRYTHLDDDGAPGLWVLPTGKPNWRAVDDRYAEFAFVLVADDPIKTGATYTTPNPVRLPTVDGEGGYPMGAGGADAPWTATGGIVAVTVAQIPNPGDEDSHVVYAVTGPVPRPRIQLGNGQYAALNTDLALGDVWTVDTAAGTSTVNGVNRYDAWAAGSVFPLIPGSRLNPDGSISPGGVEVRLRSGAGGTDQAAGLTVTTAPSWK